MQDDLTNTGVTLLIQDIGNNLQDWKNGRVE